MHQAEQGEVQPDGDRVLDHVDRRGRARVLTGVVGRAQQLEGGEGQQPDGEVAQHRRDVVGALGRRHSVLEQGADHRLAQHQVERRGRQHQQAGQPQSARNARAEGLGLAVHVVGRHLRGQRGDHRYGRDPDRHLEERERRDVGGDAALHAVGQDEGDDRADESPRHRSIIARWKTMSASRVPSLRAWTECDRACSQRPVRKSPQASASSA